MNVASSPSVARAPAARRPWLGWPAAAALVGLGLGSAVGLPVGAVVLEWANAYLIPALVELYASGIPFCG